MIDLRQAGVDDAAELSRIQVDSWQAWPMSPFFPPPIWPSTTPSNAVSCIG